VFGGDTLEACLGAPTIEVAGLNQHGGIRLLPEAPQERGAKAAHAQ
jgi:hypothetical protein